MRIQVPLFVIIGAATAIYPFVVYMGLSEFGPTSLSLVLLSLLLARVILRGQYKQPEQWVQLTMVGSLCLLAAWFQSELLLRYYPVLMSLGFAAFFAVSLQSETTLVERFARAFVKKIEPHQRQYMRGLTKIWAGLLLLNAGVAAYTACCLSLKLWTLYNGAIAYIVFGVFTLGELVNRHFYKKRYAKRNAATIDSPKT